MSEGQRPDPNQAVANEVASPREKPATNGGRDERMRRAIEAARRQAEERASAEILALEEDLVRERERAARSLERVQRRLEEAEVRAKENVTSTDGGERNEAVEAAERRLNEVAEQIEAAGARVESAEAKLAEERRRLQHEAGERLDAEMRRLRAESDAKIEEALAKVESDTQGRVDRRLAEREEEIRNEAEERVRTTMETAREETERRLQDEIETARLDAEAEARTAAAEWLRGQKDALQREAAEQAERSFAERERELAAGLEEAPRASRTAEHQVRETPDRDETAEQKAVEPDEPKVGFLRRRSEAREARHAQKAVERQAREEKSAKEKALAAKRKDPSDEKATEKKPAKATAEPARRGDPLDVNKATFEQFRELGLSVTQATRVIAYRERKHGFQSVDDLDTVPGLPPELMSEIRDQLTA